MKTTILILTLSLLSAASYAEEQLHFAHELYPKSPMQQERLDLELTPVGFAPRKNAGIAVGLSVLMPGLGHVYLEDYKTACGLFGSTSLYAGLALSRPESETLVSTNLCLINNTWFYGIYAAYRDARTFNGLEGYLYPMPKETLSELALAPFQWSVIKKREVWLGFLADLSLAIGLMYLTGPKTSELHIERSHAGQSFPLVAFPVGIGEEAFFRGFLQPWLSEGLSPWGGIAVSSLAFGAAHIPNTKDLNRAEKRHYLSVILPYITVTGAYYGWVSHKNCSLKESVALHSWYDFAVFLASYSLAKSTGVDEGNFAFSIPF